MFADFKLLCFCNINEMKDISIENPLTHDYTQGSLYNYTLQVVHIYLGIKCFGYDVELLCKTPHRSYSKITGNWLPAHLPWIFTGARRLFTGIIALGRA